MRILCVVCLSVGVAWALPRVELVVRDSAGQPIPGARVLLDRLRQGYVTDASGRVVWQNLPAGRYRFVVSHLGFRTYELEATIWRDTTLTCVLVAEAVALPELTVEGERESPLSVSSVPILRIGPRELDVHRGQSVGELLWMIPGAGSIATGPAIAKPTLRGMTGERLVVLSDRLPLQGQNWGIEHAPELDPLLVGSVEVLRGTAAVQYGTEALAGVIRFVPASLRVESGLRWQVRLEGFSVNRQGAAALWTEGAHGPVGWQMLLSARRAADARTPHYWLANTAFEQYNGAATVHYRLREHTSVRGRLQLYTGRLGVFAGMHLGNLSDLERALQAGRPLVERPPSYEISPPFQRIEHLLGELVAESEESSAGRWMLLFAWQQNRRREYDAHRLWGDEPSGRRAAYDVTQTTWNMRAELQRSWLAGLSSLALDVRRQGNVSEGRDRFVPNSLSHLLGVGVWQQWVWGTWHAFVGVRADMVWLSVWQFRGGSRDERPHRWEGTALSAALRKSWRQWELRGSIATGWRSPNAVELYAHGVHHGAAILEIGDTTLASERLWMGELAGAYRARSWQAEVTAFLYWFPRYIGAMPTGQTALTIRGAFPVFSYRALPAFIAGIEVQLQAELTTWLRLELQGASLRGWRRDDGSALYGIPPARLAGRLHAHVPSAEETFVELGCSVVGRAQSSPLDFAPAPPGYVLWEAATGLQYRLRAGLLSLSVHVRNLLNRAYRDYMSRLRYFAEEPGRTLALRVEWQW